MSLRFLEIFFANASRFSFFAYNDSCNSCCLSDPFLFISNNNKIFLKIISNFIPRAVALIYTS